MTYGITIRHCTIANDRPHLRRQRLTRAPSADTGLQALCILCLIGSIGEQIFCGAADDGGGDRDHVMAREILASAGFNLLQIEAEIMRASLAADRLVRSEQHRIRVIANALMQRGSLSGADILCLLERRRSVAAQ